MGGLRTVLHRLMGRDADAERTSGLLLSEKVGRARAERSEHQAAFLAEAGRILATSLEYETTLATVARLAVPYFADWCAVDLTGRDGSTHRVAIAHRDPAKVEVALDVQRRYPINPDAPYGAAHVLRTGRPEL